MKHVRPTVADIEEIDALIGSFPHECVDSRLKEQNIEIQTIQIPKSFAKYFALMQSISGNLANQTLVDFGCGLGVFVAQARLLGMRSEGIDIFVEYEERCLDAAKIIAECISSTPLNLSKLDLLTDDVSRKADFVTSFGMLEHIHGSEARDRVLGKIMSAVRPGGHLILTCGPNKRFPVDFHHYGPRFLFYHCLPTDLRRVYLRIFGKREQNQDPTWLNGLSVSEIKDSLLTYGCETVEQVFPLWVSLARSSIFGYPFIRNILFSLARLLTWMKAEPVIILVARKAAD